MKKGDDSSFRYKNSVYYLGLLLGGCLIAVWSDICISKPSELGYLMLSLSLIFIIGITFDYLQFQIIVYNDRIEIHRFFKTTVLFWKEIDYIYDDTIWPYSKFGWIVWGIAPKTGIKKPGFAIWGYCERRMELLSIIVERSRPYVNEITPLVIQQLEKWEKKQLKRKKKLMKKDQTDA